MVVFRSLQISGCSKYIEYIFLIITNMHAYLHNFNHNIYITHTTLFLY